MFQTSFRIATSQACIAGLDSWRDGLHLATSTELIWTKRPLSAVNAAAAVCGGLRSSSGKTGKTAASTNWFWALQLLRSSVTAEVELDIVAFNAMVGVDTWQRSLGHFGQMQHSRVSPDRITYSAFHVPWRCALQMAMLTRYTSQSPESHESHVSMLKSAAASAETATTPGSKLWQICLSIFDEDKAIVHSGDAACMQYLKIFYVS